jgi:cysteine synthase
LNLLQSSVVPNKTKTVVEYSSGSTVLSMSLIARAFYGLPDVRAFLSNKTSLAKIRLMQLFGINMYDTPYTSPMPLILILVARYLVARHNRSPLMNVEASGLRKD